MPQTLLKNVGFLAQLDPQTRAQVESRVRIVRVRKGQIVIDHGSPGHDVYFVLEGNFDVLVYSPNGREIYMRKISAGALFGEYAALDRGTRSATVVAAGGGQLAVLSAADFLSCLRASPDAAIWLANEFASQIRALTERVFELSALNVRSRLHCELLRLCTVSRTSGNTALIDPAPTHAELAGRIGTHREAVTREMNDLAAMKVLKQEGRRLEILDVTKLAEMVRTTGADAVVNPRSKPDDQSSND